MADENTETRKMTLIYTKDKYSEKVSPITLVDNADIAKTLAYLIEQSGSKAVVVDVPVWPNIMKDA